MKYSIQSILYTGVAGMALLATSAKADTYVERTVVTPAPAGEYVVRTEPVIVQQPDVYVYSYPSDRSYRRDWQEWENHHGDGEEHVARDSFEDRSRDEHRGQ